MDAAVIDTENKTQNIRCPHGMEIEYCCQKGETSKIAIRCVRGLVKGLDDAQLLTRKSHAFNLANMEADGNDDLEARMEKARRSDCQRTRSDVVQGLAVALGR